MAGYIISLDSIVSLQLYAENGIYATKLSTPSAGWARHHEGTFADYATMQVGDNIYFFINRRIYGIGRLIAVGSDCKYFNYQGAGHPQISEHETLESSILWDEGPHSVNQRCICIFEPDPDFFKTGIDMDDVLSSNPSAFKMLRAFWKLSFVKFDDEENQAFRDIILKRNQVSLAVDGAPARDSVFTFRPSHPRLLDRLPNADYSIGSGMGAVLKACADGSRIRHEMALEAGILHQLSIRDSETCSIFGEWDYLSHQVVASPFKPIDYMDKMDLFGYRYLPGFKPTKLRFLVGEIKRDAASVENVDQLLKYVDWVRDEYCFGDYSMIHAFLVASDFPHGIAEHGKDVASRKYTVGMRPAQSLEWRNLKLVRYEFEPIQKRLKFQLIGEDQVAQHHRHPGIDYGDVTVGPDFSDPLPEFDV